MIDQGTFKDPESDTIYYTANMKNGDPRPSWAYFLPLSRTFRMQGNFVGMMEFQVRAFDRTDQYASVPATFRLTFTNALP